MSKDVTILTSANHTSLVKTFSGPDLKEQLFAIGKEFNVTEEPASDLQSLSKILQRLENDPTQTIIRGSLIEDAYKGRAGAYWVELSAALEGPERRLFRRLGKNNAVIATRELIKRETIVRFSIELEKLRPVHLSLYCSILTPIRVVALCGDRYSQSPHTPFCYE
jgi:hypothetical protein